MVGHMKKRLELSVAEMMQLRNDGYSNKDIARILDISVATVYNYIGKQGCHIPSATASFISKPKPDTPPPTQPPKITVVSRVVSIDGYLFEIPSISSIVSVTFSDGQSVKMPADDISKLADALMTAKEYMAKEAKHND